MKKAAFSVPPNSNGGGGGGHRRDKSSPPFHPINPKKKLKQSESTRVCVGKTLKVDLKTLTENSTRFSNVERGRFARVCVELDLQKKLVPRVIAANSIYNVEYEGLYLICFVCGRYGHRKETCSWTLRNPQQLDPRNSNETKSDAASTSRLQQEKNREQPDQDSSTANLKIAAEEEFGSWMIVNRRGRFRTQKNNMVKETKRNIGSGSRNVRGHRGENSQIQFTVLEGLQEDEMVLSEDNKIVERGEAEWWQREDNLVQKGQMEKENRLEKSTQDVVGYAGKEKKRRIKKGAGNKMFPATVQEVVRRYDINVLCLLETRVSGCRADEVVRRCGFSNWLGVEASGYTGGIWVLWNDHEMQVNYICSSTQLLHCEICDLRNGEKYLTSFVYGETSRAKRMNLWHSLRTIAGHLERAWLVVGDFNTFLKPQDKLGGSPPNYQAMRNFADCVSDTGLMEIPIVGERFTWEKKGVKERLDWAFGNLEWELNFS
ncbi:uncharacterized protein LOC114746133 [Neltuma alba]|uniref:uncharacterized protein LOC114746133 n=1 Tax=Neltuma alba TaxID=207710 RepID=UPI0010A2CC2F|nr:uncharacterized protein LOC114746133 [Prosopis alba]